MTEDKHNEVIEEIRKIRAKIYEEDKDLTPEEHAEKMNRIARPIAEKLGLEIVSGKTKKTVSTAKPTS